MDYCNELVRIAEFQGLSSAISPRINGDIFSTTKTAQTTGPEMQVPPMSQGLKPCFRHTKLLISDEQCQFLSRKMINELASWKLTWHPLVFEDFPTGNCNYWVPPSLWGYIPSHAKTWFSGIREFWLDPVDPQTMSWFRNPSTIVHF